MKRIIAILLVIATVFAFVSCAENEETASYAIKAGDTEISLAAYYSQLLTSKNEFLINYIGASTDNPAIWTQDSPSGNNESVGDTITRMTIEDMVQFAWVVEYARDNGATLSDEDMEKLAEGVKSMKERFESEEEYQEYLTTLKFDQEGIEEYLKLTLLYDKGFHLLIGENGLYAVEESEYDDFYNNNFYTVKHIFINNVSKETEDGEAVELTEDEKKEKEEKAEQIYSDLTEGASFDTLYMLGEDNMAGLYPDGMTYTDGMIGDTNYEDAVKALEIGEYTKVEGYYGGIYIVMRVPLSQTDREEYDTYIRTAVHSDLQEKIYADHKDEVIVNYDLINEYNIVDVPIMS